MKESHGGWASKEGKIQESGWLWPEAVSLRRQERREPRVDVEQSDLDMQRDIPSATIGRGACSTGEWGRGLKEKN